MTQPADPAAVDPGERRAAGRAPGTGPLLALTLFVRVGVGCYLRLRVEGRDRLPPGPALLCFNHQSWADPFVLVAAALPARPDLLFFGPREADMRIGRKNRLIAWSQRGVPFRPDKRGLVEVARRVEAVFARGDRLADRAGGTDPRRRARGPAVRRGRRLLRRCAPASRSSRSRSWA